jgi:hypothetical protein
MKSSTCGIRTIFIVNARVISEIAEVMPDYEVISLTEASSKGYIHSDFRSLPSAQKEGVTLLNPNS